jgi:myosin heavy subunit
MNPFKRLSIYENETLKRYIGKKLPEEEPHIFAIAEAAFSSLRSTKKNQSVIISGESGAGKRLTICLLLTSLVNPQNLSSSLSRLARHLKIKSPGYSSKF